MPQESVLMPWLKTFISFHLQHLLLLLETHQCVVDQTIITDLAEQLCNLHPISTALGEGGPLCSAFKRRYFKEQFQCVGSVEYILDSHKNKTFQYVPILETLQEVLKNKDIAPEILSRNLNSTQYIKSVFDGKFFKQNDFNAGDETCLSIILYVILRFVTHLELRERNIK